MISFYGSALPEQLGVRDQTGTSQFAWTQSITRKRWLAAGAGWMLVASAVWGGSISALVTWWSGPNKPLQLDALQPGRFDIMGIVPVGYALFAMVLGIAAGALLRRTLPAMAATLAVFIAVRPGSPFARPHYMSAITTVVKLTGNSAPGDPPGCSPRGSARSPDSLSRPRRGLPPSTCPPAPARRRRDA